MSRSGSEQMVDRLAHAFTPAEWSGRSLVVGIAAFAAVATVTVVQRALLADSTTGWIITSVHGAVVALVVPLLSIRAVRQWRAAQSSSAVPE